MALAVLCLGAADAAAQRVALRSQITPNCPSSASPTRWKFADIYGDGNIAVQGSYGCRGAFIYDISNPASPVLASWYNPGSNIQFLEAIVIGNRGYFGAGNSNGGVHIVDLSNPYSPQLLGIVNSTNGNGHNIIHEMMVFDQNGARYLVENYNLLSSSQKIIKFINVSNPAAPVFKWDLNPTDTTWVHAMHIRGNRMYLSGWGGRIDIYDISNLATQAPTLLGTIVGNSTNHSTWTSEDGRYLYSARETTDGDLRVYDVQNPQQPLLVKSIRAGDYALNAITPHNPVVMGNKLYVSWYQAGVQIFDISNPANPVRIGQYDTYSPTFAQPVEEKQLMESAGPWDIACGDPEFRSSLPTSYDGNWAVYPFLGEDKVLLGDLTNGLLIVDASRIATPKNVVSDFDGDRKTDLSVFTPANGAWTIESSSNSSSWSPIWGIATDVITPGDYDGDGRSDVAVWRPGNGAWYVLNSSGGVTIAQFGMNGDIPVEGDYDADGKTDLAVYRPSTGVWYMNQSTLGFRAVQWGAAGDKPVVGDYDGDGKTDLTVFRPSSGVWYVLQSSSSIALYASWGASGDKPVEGDFDGDGRTDFAVYRPSEGIWYILRSSTGSLLAATFGLAEDMPIAADYDGDGRADIAVFRPSTSTWYRLNSSDGAFYARVFGQTGDQPAPSAAQPQ
ncbi:MAG: FG-GAP-like repeat-containing protein [Pyrinomonadaceae bacterium]